MRTAVAIVATSLLTALAVHAVDAGAAPTTVQATSFEVVNASGSVTARLDASGLSLFSGNVIVSGEFGATTLTGSVLSFEEQNLETGSVTPVQLYSGGLVVASGPNTANFAAAGAVFNRGSLFNPSSASVGPDGFGVGSTLIGGDSITMGATLIGRNFVSVQTTDRTAGVWIGCPDVAVPGDRTAMPYLTITGPPGLMETTLSVNKPAIMLKNAKGKITFRK